MHQTTPAIRLDGKAEKGFVRQPDIAVERPPGTPSRPLRRGFRHEHRMSALGNHRKNRTTRYAFAFISVQQLDVGPARKCRSSPNPPAVQPAHQSFQQQPPGRKFWSRGQIGDNPAAIGSAFRNSCTLRSPAELRSDVVFPAPLGPAISRPSVGLGCFLLNSLCFLFRAAGVFRCFSGGVHWRTLSSVKASWWASWSASLERLAAVSLGRTGMGRPTEVEPPERENTGVEPPALEPRITRITLIKSEESEFDWICSFS